jgi:hypothetical protein
MKLPPSFADLYYNQAGLEGLSPVFLNEVPNASTVDAMPGLRVSGISSTCLTFADVAAKVAAGRQETTWSAYGYSTKDV